MVARQQARPPSIFKASTLASEIRALTPVSNKEPYLVSRKNLYPEIPYEFY